MNDLQEMMREIDAQRDVMISYAQHEKERLLNKTCFGISGILSSEKESATTVLQAHQKSSGLWNVSLLPEFNNFSYETFEPRTIHYNEDTSLSTSQPQPQPQPIINPSRPKSVNLQIPIQMPGRSLPAPNPIQSTVSEEIWKEYVTEGLKK